MLRFPLCALLLFLAGSLHRCSAQATGPETVGGPFENREFFYYGMPAEIGATDTTAGWHSGGQRLVIRGRMLRLDGVTPAAGVVLYFYQTDATGVYPTLGLSDPRVARHGSLRGWVKSDKEGRYAIYTVRPAPYPGRDDPAHIHPALLEPGIEVPYYLDAFVFDDDPLLTTARRRGAENRGGSGVLRVKKVGDRQIAEHNIIVGLNIPGHPAESAVGLRSGPAIGEDLTSFTPYHVHGPDAGTRVCPVCKYGKYRGALLFVGAGADWSAIERWLAFLEGQAKQGTGALRVFLVDGDNSELTRANRIRRLEELATCLNLRHLALTLVPNLQDTGSEVNTLGLHPEARLTLLLYDNGNVIGNWVDPLPTPERFAEVGGRLGGGAR